MAGEGAGERGRSPRTVFCGAVSASYLESLQSWVNNPTRTLVEMGAPGPWPLPAEVMRHGRVTGRTPFLIKVNHSWGVNKAGGGGTNLLGSRPGAGGWVWFGARTRHIAGVSVSGANPRSALEAADKKTQPCKSCFGYQAHVSKPNQQELAREGQ